MCDPLSDLPSVALGPAIPAKGYLVEEIRDGLFWVGDGLYNAMFLVHGDGVITVDAPPALGGKYLAAISEVTAKPITHLVYSHSHSDHIGAAHLFPPGIAIVAHHETTATLVRRSDAARPLPTLSVTEPHFVLTVGGQTLHLGYHGINHEAGNLFIHAPRQRVLMLVDVIYPGWIPYNRLGNANDVQGFIDAHDYSLAYDFDTFVGGHVNRPGSRQDVETARSYVLELRETARAAMGRIDIGTVIARTGTSNKWLLSNGYFDAIVEAIAEDMRPKWRDRLGGFEQCIAENAYKMMSAIYVEFAATPPHESRGGESNA